MLVFLITCDGQKCGLHFSCPREACWRSCLLVTHWSVGTRASRLTAQLDGSNKSPGLGLPYAGPPNPSPPHPSPDAVTKHKPAPTEGTSHAKSPQSHNESINFSAFSWRSCDVLEDFDSMLFVIVLMLCEFFFVLNYVFKRSLSVV